MTSLKVGDLVEAIEDAEHSLDTETFFLRKGNRYTVTAVLFWGYVQVDNVDGTYWAAYRFKRVKA